MIEIDLSSRQSLKKALAFQPGTRDGRNYPELGLSPWQPIKMAQLAGRTVFVGFRLPDFCESSNVARLSSTLLEHNRRPGIFRP